MIEDKIKVMLVGASSTGKTCLRKAIIKEQFNQLYQPTIGIDFTKTYLQFQKVKYNLFIWEATGGCKFMEITQNNYYPSVQFFIFVYDITQRSTFQYLKQYISQKIMKNDKIGQCYAIIIGNKSDLQTKREVSYQEGLQLGLSVGGFQQASAKTGKNIHNFLQEMLIRKLSKHSTMKQIYKLRKKAQTI